MSKKAVIRQNLFSGIFFITKKLAYEKKNKENKHHFLSENCSTFFTRKFRAIKKILILVISIEAHLPTVRLDAEGVQGLVHRVESQREGERNCEQGCKG